MAFKMERILGTIRRFIPRPRKAAAVTSQETEEVAPQDEKMMVARFDALVPATDLTSSMVDYPKARAEAHTLADKIRGTIAAVRSSPIVTDSATAGQRFLRLADTYYDDIISIQTLEGEQLRRLEAGQATVGEGLYAHLLSTGSELVAFKNLNEQLSIVRRHIQGRERLEEIVRGCLFLSCGILLFRLGEVRLADFVNYQGKNQSPVPYFDYLTQALLVVPRNNHQEVFEQNRGPLVNDYPNLAIQTIDVMTNRMAFLLAVNDQAAQVLIKVSQDKPYPLNSMGQLAAELVFKIDEIRQRSVDAFTHPHSKYFPEMKEALSAFLVDRGTIRRALYVLTATSRTNFQSLYRFVSDPPALVTEEDSQFYSRLASEVREYTSSINDALGFLLDDDILSILDFTENVPHPTDVSLDLSGLGHTVSAIFQKTSQRLYSVNPSDIEWGNLYAPQAVSVEFDQNRPHKFKVALSFNNETTQESTDVEFDLDIARRRLDLNILEDPNRPESSLTAAFRIALVAATGNILALIRTQAEKIYLDRHQTAAQPAVSPLPTEKRTRFQDPVYQLRKEARVAKPNTDEEGLDLSAENLDSIAEATFGDKKIVNYINLAEGEELDDKLSSLSIVDQEIILEAIKEFNERGTGGNLTRKKKKGRDGLPRWTLSIGCTVPKGARVLLIPEATAKGFRSFHIEDIRYRKDIYRRNFL